MKKLKGDRLNRWFCTMRANLAHIAAAGIVQESGEPCKEIGELQIAAQ